VSAATNFSFDERLTNEQVFLMVEVLSNHLLLSSFSIGEDSNR